MAERKLTVLQLLPALESGGVERGTLELGAGLVKAGHRSLVVSAGGQLVSRLTGQGAHSVADRQEVAVDTAAGEASAAPGAG
jgi:hypothetical protein